MCKTTPEPSRHAPFPARITFLTQICAARSLVTASLATVFATALVLSSQAQTVRTVAQPVTVTVPVGSTLSNGVDFTSTVANAVTPVHLSIASLPAGVGYVLTTNDFTTNATGVLILNTTNVPEGTYDYQLDASGGAARSLLLRLQSAHVWTGGTFTNGGTADFSDPGNWSNNSVPGATSDVVLTDSSAQASGATTTNMLISTDTEIASLREAITSGATRQHNIQIEPGKTLRITGTNGLTIIRDRSDTVQEWRLVFTGSDGTLIVSNENASVLTFNQANQNGRLLLDTLGTFKVDAYRYAVSDYRSYPNYASLKDNNYTGNALPQQGPGGHNYLARTNIIKLYFAGDTNDWMDPVFREYAMVIVRNETSGSTQRNPFRLGISNVFFMNSLCYAGSSAPGNDGNGAMVFNPSFAASNCIAIFRGPEGMTNRMAMMALSDGAGPGSTSSACKSVMDLSAGLVDALVDRLYLARDRTNSTGSDPAASPSATLTMAAGVFDVNNAIIGYQGQGDASTGPNYCRGNLNVRTGGVFRVNSTLVLGYTSASASGPMNAENGYGQISLDGGTLMASNISVGGVTKLSTLNNISLTRGTLIVTNGIADPVKPLNSLSFSAPNVSDTSVLTVHVTGTDATNVFVDTLATSGSGVNALRIASLPNITYPATFHIIQYAQGSVSFQKALLPPGYNGGIINNGPGSTIDIQVSTTVPKNLLWRGASQNWNDSENNWLDIDTGLMTNYVDTDFVSFDDAPGYPTDINVQLSSMLPGGITMSNTTLNYKFSGSGSFTGSGVLSKTGTGTLELSVPTSLNVQVNQGSLVGNGSAAAVVVASGARMSFTGNISGGLACAGTATSSGTINGTVNVQSGGTLTNAGTINGTPNMSSGSLLYNSGSITYSGGVTTPTNSVLYNAGYITGGSMNIGGTLIDTGAGNFTFDTTLTINGGNSNGAGLFYPGGLLSIGTTRIQDGNCIPIPGTNICFPGRVLLAAGSTNVFKINKNSSANTELRAAFTDFGGSQGSLTFNGGTLLITNVGSTPFAPGDSFKLFSRLNGGDINPTGAATNTYPIIVPSIPGNGMAWDLSALRPSGIIRIIPVATTPTNLSYSYTYYAGFIVTNVTTTSTNMTTNNVFLTQWQWPSDYIGWKLQSQQNPLTIGISNNWKTLPPSVWTNSILTTNIVTKDADKATTFYRLASPDAVDPP